MPETPAWTAADVASDFAASPFMSAFGLEVVACDAAKGELAVRAPFRPGVERLPNTGQWHGGSIAALIDTVGDYAAALQLGRALPTIDMRVDYLRPAMNTSLLFRGAVRRSGRTVAVVDVEVLDDKGALIAIGRCVYGTAPPRQG
jgi:uncharacterized protein (TIGR00369 family)